MTILLFSLRGVPDDEADDVRELLTAQEIDFYETSAGNWGVSMPAIWLRDDTQWQQARELIATYQQQRYLTARATYLQNQQHAGKTSLLNALRVQPIGHVFYWLSSFLVIYASVKFLFELGL